MTRDIDRLELKRRLAQSKRLGSENLDLTTRERLAALTSEIEGLIADLDSEDARFLDEDAVAERGSLSPSRAR